MGTAKAYLFRVFSHSAVSYSISEEYKYDVPDDVKRRAVTAGLIGGILFFIVAIILSVCTVKICNKKRRRKQERGETFFTLKTCLFLRRPEWSHVQCILLIDDPSIIL